ncbi:MAG: class I SAM-dependent methyltransferase [Syntrophales bacterium LBB04]|nr:class I SAM-dependent methyltransferase [Syntrophales bacterium LBB04]
MQDKLWNYYQVEGVSSFDKSYPRLLYLARQCRRGQKVLNIGVGSGYLEQELISLGAETYALDPSEKTIETLRKKLGMNNNACVGYSNKIPFETGFFDVVIMTEVLEHLDNEILPATLSEVYRALNYGGVFIGTVPHKEALQENIVFCPYCESKFHRWGHVQSFDNKSIRSLLAYAGFTKISLSVRAFPDWHRKGVKFLLKSLMRYTLGRLGAAIINPNIYFKAYKN